MKKKRQEIKNTFLSLLQYAFTLDCEISNSEMLPQDC